jgi:hypothetical protein
MTCDSAPSPDRSPARGKGIATALALGTLLAGGWVAAAAVPVHAARPLDCITPVLCPTVSVPTLPTVSLPLPTTNATTTSTTQPTTATTNDPARTSENSPQQPSAVFSFTLRTSVHARQHRRWVVMRLSVSQAANIAANLLRGRTVVTRGRYAARPGSNRFNLYLPQRAKAGRAVLDVDLIAGSTRRRIVRTLVLPSR